MPRLKTWIPNIPKIRKQLAEMQPKQPLGPADLQQMFGIGKSAAYDLVQLIGPSPEYGTEAATSCIVTAEAVLNYLRYSPEGQASEMEQARRERVERTLEDAKADQELRKHKLPVSSIDQWFRLKDLPVTIEAGLLRRSVVIQFDDANDFLRTLHRLSNALRGPDFDRFLALLDAHAKPVVEVEPPKEYFSFWIACEVCGGNGGECSACGGTGEKKEVPA
jgi:flavin-binding protein dodecin